MKSTPTNILITGATGDIGAALAIAYAAPGIRLALTGKIQERLDAITLECEQKGAEVTNCEIDVRDEQAMTQWINEIDAKHPIDLVVANAGVTSSIEDDGSPEPWDRIKRVFDINLYGVLHTITPLVEPMRQRGHGQIAIVSSLAAYRGLPITPAYCGSKAGIKVYGEAMRGVLKEDGVKVNIICPGFVKSTMSDKFSRPKPFTITADQAAQYIIKGLKKNTECISFPFPLNLGTWMMSILPGPLADFFTRISGYGKH